VASSRVDSSQPVTLREVAAALARCQGCTVTSMVNRRAAQTVSEFGASRSIVLADPFLLLGVHLRP
jgi:hypothetical protein